MTSISMHYGDILKKVEMVIESCQTVEQIAAAWKFADLFEEHCKRINVNSQTRMVMRSTVNNLLEDRWEVLRLKKISEVNE
jgi:hypothetical protein